MVSVSFKNINFWPSYGQKWRACPYLGIRFWANWAEIFRRAQETIVYQLVMINPSYDAYF